MTSLDTGEHNLNDTFYRKGDYHRYLAEFASGEKRKVAATAAHEAYKVYMGIAFIHASNQADQLPRMQLMLHKPN
jgi:hypothetical protein